MFLEVVADREGFEPSKAINLTRVPGVLLQPLGHLPICAAVKPAALKISGI